MSARLSGLLHGEFLRVWVINLGYLVESSFDATGLVSPLVTLNFPLPGRFSFFKDRYSLN